MGFGEFIDRILGRDNQPTPQSATPIPKAQAPVVGELQKRGVRFWREVENPGSTSAGPKSPDEPQQS